MNTHTVHTAKLLTAVIAVAVATAGGELQYS
jgi:hypothetical protein